MLAKIHAIIFLALLFVNGVRSQDENIGVNDKAGRYVDRGDAKIYYEVYGKGRPVLLLHGGLYGYIDEYKHYISALSRDYLVIAIATRGHGRSELGSKPLSYRLFADDAVSVLRNEGKDSAMVIGFSDGAITAYVLAAEYPTVTQKIVAIGGGLSLSAYHTVGMQWLRSFSPEKFQKSNAQFVEERKKIMPQPEKWNEFLEKLKGAWLEPVWVSPDKAKNITCPVLTIGGDKDDYMKIDAFVHAHQSIKHSRLAIIPNAGHVQSMENPLVLNQIIRPFLAE